MDLTTIPAVDMLTSCRDEGLRISKVNREQKYIYPSSSRSKPIWTACSVDHEKIHNPYLRPIVHISNIDDFLLYFYGVFPSFLKLDNAFLLSSTEQSDK